MARARWNTGIASPWRSRSTSRRPQPATSLASAGASAMPRSSQSSALSKSPARVRASALSRNSTGSVAPASTAAPARSAARCRSPTRRAASMPERSGEMLTRTACLRWAELSKRGGVAEPGDPRRQHRQDPLKLRTIGQPLTFAVPIEPLTNLGGARRIDGPHPRQGGDLGHARMPVQAQERADRLGLGFVFVLLLFVAVFEEIQRHL